MSTMNERIAGWLAEGKLVVAPVAVAGRVLYQRISSASDAVLDAKQRPANSIKEFFFPRHEQIFRYRIEGKEIALSDVAPDEREQIVIGAKPCDAAALPILDHVFNWDCEDTFYTTRRAHTTVVTLACTREGDDACFCTSVGGGPAAESGSDAMVFEAGEVRTVTEKGRALFGDAADPAPSRSRLGNGRAAAVVEGAAAAGAPVGTEAAVEVAAVAVADPAPSRSRLGNGAEGAVEIAARKRFDPAAIARFLEANFESPLWKDLTLTCLGCGACAYTCPTCHCFDIVDEGNRAGGARVKNWDSCQFPLFTLHASGHNPRSAQPQRQRQRLLHKFLIYPQKFNAVLCTGCGNCERNCPVGLGVLKVLRAIHERQSVQA